jgi:hypothetical protein
MNESSKYYSKLMSQSVLEYVICIVMFCWALVKTLGLGLLQLWLLCIHLVCGLDNCDSSGKGDYYCYS